MSTIENTVRNALNTNGAGHYYDRYAVPVVDALQAREDSIKDGLMAFANEKGLSEGEVNSLFVAVGLTEPAPEPVDMQAVGDNSDLHAQVGEVLTTLRSLQTTINGLQSFARRHGYVG